MELILNKIEEHFGDLNFNEKAHEYSVKDKKLKGSVSSLIHDFVTPFDREGVSKRMSIKTGIPQADILKQWDDINKEATTRGTRVHAFGELYPFDRSLVPSCPQEKAIVKFWQEVPPHIVPVAAEVRMYHLKKMFPGTMDLLLFDTIKGHYIIADYKTNKDLFKNFAEQKMTGIFSHKLDSPFNHYQVQLSFYQILLEQLGIQVGRRILIWLTPDAEYKMYDTEDLTETLKSYLEVKYPSNN